MTAPEPRCSGVPGLTEAYSAVRQPLPDDPAITAQALVGQTLQRELPQAQLALVLTELWRAADTLRVAHALAGDDAKTAELQALVVEIHAAPRNHG